MAVFEQFFAFLTPKTPRRPRSDPPYVWSTRQSAPFALCNSPGGCVDFLQTAKMCHFQGIFGQTDSISKQQFWDFVCFCIKTPETWFFSATNALVTNRNSFNRFRAFRFVKKTTLKKSNFEINFDQKASFWPTVQYYYHDLFLDWESHRPNSNISSCQFYHLL